MLRSSSSSSCIERKYHGRHATTSLKRSCPNLNIIKFAALLGLYSNFILTFYPSIPNAFPLTRFGSPCQLFFNIRKETTGLLIMLDTSWTEHFKHLIAYLIPYPFSNPTSVSTKIIQLALQSVL